jgi:hypothetical protein
VEPNDGKESIYVPFCGGADRLGLCNEWAGNIAGPETWDSAQRLVTSLLRLKEVLMADIWIERSVQELAIPSVRTCGFRCASLFGTKYIILLLPLLLRNCQIRKSISKAPIFLLRLR